MSDDRFVNREALRHRLEELPGEKLPHVRVGYKLLSQAPPEQRREFVNLILESTESGRHVEFDQAARLLGIRSDLLSDVLSAVALSIGAVIDLSISPEDFVEFGRGKIFEDDQADIAREVISIIVSRRVRLEAGVKSMSLANAILPSFRGMSAEVDIRLGFEGDSTSLTGTVPVAIIHIGTDVNKQLWFQATTDAVQTLAEKFGKLAEQLRAAEAVIERLK